jgi:hypothetical protein
MIFEAEHSTLCILLDVDGGRVYRVSLIISVRFALSMTRTVV